MCFEFLEKRRIGVQWCLSDDGQILQTHRVRSSLTTKLQRIQHRLQIAHLETIDRIDELRVDVVPRPRVRGLRIHNIYGSFTMQLPQCTTHAYSSLGVSFCVPASASFRLRQPDRSLTLACWPPMSMALAASAMMYNPAFVRSI